LLRYFKPFVLCAVVAWPFTASARRGDVRLAIEPGLASLVLEGAQRSWGGLGGASLQVGIGDLVGIEAHIEDKRFPGPQVRAVAWDLAVVYALDILAVSPTFAIGLAQTRLSGGASDRDTVALLGVGLDVRLGRWLTAGAVFRYYPLFDSGLTNPAYSSLNARLGIIFGSDPERN
jgi:hypothetical protein